MTAATTYTAEYYDLQRPHSQNAFPSKRILLFLPFICLLGQRGVYVELRIGLKERDGVLSVTEAKAWICTIVPLAGQRQQCHPYTVVGSPCCDRHRHSLRINSFTSSFIAILMMAVVSLVLSWCK
jgi:hypothetical protein